MQVERYTRKGKSGRKWDSKAKRRSGASEIRDRRNKMIINGNATATTDFAEIKYFRVYSQSSCLRFVPWPIDGEPSEGAPLAPFTESGKT